MAGAGAGCSTVILQVQGSDSYPGVAGGWWLVAVYYMKSYQSYKHPQHNPLPGTVLSEKDRGPLSCLWPKVSIR